MLPTRLWTPFLFSNQNMENTEFVCSVEKENQTGFYRLHTKWEGNKFKINVASKDASWSGQMTPERVQQMSRMLEMSTDNYLDDCKSSLTSNDGKPGLVYAVEDGHFVWKRVEDEDTGVKIKMGMIPLEPTNFVDTIQEMMNVALNVNKNLMRRLAQTDDEKLQYESSINKSWDKLNESQIEFKSIRQNMLANFVHILNAKKEKISQLEQELIWAKTSQPKKRQKNCNVYEQDTDSDGEPPPPPPNKKKTKSMPSLKAMIDAQK